MKKVLIVEDDIISATMLEMGFNSRGFSVINKMDNADHLTAFCEQNKPDLILLDIMLNGSDDGITAAEKLRKSMDTPVIFLTALSNTKTKDKISRIANTHYFMKPYDVKVIIEKAKEVIEG